MIEINSISKKKKTSQPTESSKICWRKYNRISHSKHKLQLAQKREDVQWNERGLKTFWIFFHFGIFSSSCFFLFCNLRASSRMQMLAVFFFYRETFFLCLFLLSLFRSVSFICQDSLHSAQTVNMRKLSSSNSIVMTVHMQFARRAWFIIAQPHIAPFKCIRLSQTHKKKSIANDKKQTKSLTSSKTKIPSEHSTSSRDIAVDKSPNEWMHLVYLYFLMHTRLQSQPGPAKI